MSTSLYIDNHAHTFESSRQPIRIEHDPSRQHDSSRQPTRIEHDTEKNQTQPSREGGRPFSALGSSRLAIAYLKTCGSSTRLFYHFIVKQNQEQQQKPESTRLLKTGGQKPPQYLQDITETESDTEMKLTTTV